MHDWMLAQRLHDADARHAETVLAQRRALEERAATNRQPAPAPPRARRSLLRFRVRGTMGA